MPDSTLSPFLNPFLSSTQGSNGQAIRQSADWEYDERRFEQEAETSKPNPETSVLGSISFNQTTEVVNTAVDSVGDIMQASGEAAIDLLQMITGIEKKGETSAPPESSVDEQLSEQTAAVKLLETRAWFDKIQNQQAQVDYDTKLNEALRIATRMVGKDEAMQMGHLDELAISTLSDIARKDQEQTTTQEDQEKSASIPNPAKQANALETQFEGGSGQFGSGTASLSSASGAAG